MKRALLLFPLLCGAPLAAVDSVMLMPRVQDYTHMHWAEGFPGAVPGAPWRRVIQTGHYAMALDTETLRIPHLGPVEGTLSHAEAARASNEAWEKLPAADLAMTLSVDGKTYRCRRGGAWTRFNGPRLIESGRFMQRADVTDLVFESDDGGGLNVEARFETAAWPDRLALVLAARPDVMPLPAGEGCFGFAGGGFGLDGRNHLEVPHSDDLEPEQFTLEMQVFVPVDHQVSGRTFPWLACKNAHEQAQGHYGIVILNGRAQARMNIGGGRENAFTVSSPETLRIEAWNHLAMSYDGAVLRLFVNHKPAGELHIGRKRVPGRGGFAFGRRQDNSGDGYHFRGVLDDIRLHHRALSLEEMKSGTSRPVREWTFRADGIASAQRLRVSWKDAAMEMRLATPWGELLERVRVPEITGWQEVGLCLDPVTMKAVGAADAIRVNAGSNPVSHDALRGWHRVNLDALTPVGDSPDDKLDRVRLVLENTGDQEEVARLLFEKTKFPGRTGAPITGLSAMLRDENGQPTGIPVQISKNWHHRPEGDVHSGQWFHGFSQVRLPARSRVELELTLCHGYWGGVAAASHAQLCLIGWGSNQLWEQSALGAWGESLCYEPDQAQAACLITDVRPAMVRGKQGGPWQWTHNVGGGDAFRLFDGKGHRVPPGRMRTAHEKHGPCLTEVTYAGRLGPGIEHQFTTSLARTDDLTRGIYRLRLDVHADTGFSRFVIFQIGADTYSYTGERTMALGHEGGLLKEWSTQWGGDVNRTAPMKCEGRIPWISLHDAVPRLKPGEQGAWANRGLIIRGWKARLGGRDAAPWIVERGVHARGSDSSTVDVVPPPDVTRLVSGDFIDATIEHVIIPMSADDYYGPNEALRTALKSGANTWRMVHREAVGNDHRIEVRRGTLIRTHPSVTIQTMQDSAELTLSGGLGHVALTFTGLTSPGGHVLTFDGRILDQSVHGSDFWQTDYDAGTRTWAQTFNLPINDAQPHRLHFTRRS